jgi:hypothetical protein
MDLFKYENNVLIVNPLAYVLLPFKVIWERDKTKSKKNAENEFAYIYFMADYKSDFSDILDDEERTNEILKVIELKKGWKPDEDINKAILFYKSRRDGMAMRMFEAARILASKIEKYCRTVDLMERDRSNKPIHNIKAINDVLKQFGSSVESLNKLESQVKKEVAENKNMIGSREKNIFEEGF